MDELTHSLCCVSIPELHRCSLSKELHLEGGMLASCKFIVMKFCLMNKEKALRSVLAAELVYVVKFDILSVKIFYKEI